MPRKPKEPSKSRQWEKDRRDRLKEKFLLLAKVLPCYNPNVRLCHDFILEHARITIEELQDEVNKILSQKSDKIKDAKDEQIRKLQDKIKRLLKRNEQLCKLLKDAGIPFPTISNNDPKFNNKLVQGKKKKTKLATAVAPKHRSEKKSADVKKKTRTRSKKAVIYVLSQPTTVAPGISQPYYLLTKPQNGNNFITNKTSSVLAINNTGTQTIPFLNINPIAKPLNPSTLFISNNTLVPQPQIIMPPSAPLIPPNTITTINSFPKIITNANLLPQSQILIPQPGSKPIVTCKVSTSNVISRTVETISTNALTSNLNTNSLSSGPVPFIPISDSTITILENTTVTIPKESSSPPKIVDSAIISLTKTSTVLSVSKSIPTAVVSVTKTIPTPLVLETKTSSVPSTGSRMITTTSSCSEANQKKIYEYMRKLPLVAPKLGLTNTTQVIKVPIPALTSKYANTYTLLNEPKSLKKEVKVKKKIKTSTAKKILKRPHEDQEGDNKKIKFDETESIHDNSQIVLKEQNADMLSVKENTEIQPSNETTNLSNNVNNNNVENCISEGAITNTVIDNTNRNNLDSGITDNCDSTGDLETPKKDISTENVFNTINSQNISKEQNETINSSTLLSTVSSPVTTTVNPSCNAVTTVICTVSEAQDDIKNLELNLVHSDLSNDIFASLQVPSGCQNPESTSPTAAFLLAFPLVSSLKVSEVMEEDNSESQRETPTLLQIGNLDVAKTTQSDTLSSSLLNLENFSFFTSKNVCGDYYNSQFNLTNNTSNNEAIKQLENNIDCNNYESFSSCIDKNNDHSKINNRNEISAKADVIEQAQQSKNVNEINTNDSEKLSENQVPLQEDNSDKQTTITEPSELFSDVPVKQTNLIPEVHTHPTPVNLNTWPGSTNFGDSCSNQQNFSRPKNQLLIEDNNTIENQNFKSQENKESSNCQEAKLHKSEIISCKTQQKLSDSSANNKYRHSSKNEQYTVQLGSTSSKQPASISNQNKTNDAFGSELLISNSNLNMKFQENLIKSTRKSDENCSNQFVSQQFSHPKNEIVQNIDGKTENVDNWNMKSNQDIKKKEIIPKPENKVLKSADHQMLHNFNSNNENINVWSEIHYQQKIDTSGSVPIQNTGNEAQNIPQYVYQQTDSSKKNQEITNQNFCEKHRPYPAVHYAKSQDLQYNTNNIVQNLSHCNKDQSGSFWLMDSMPYNNTYENSAPFNVYNDKSATSKKHDIVQNSESHKNSFQYPTCNKKPNIWGQDWQDVNISYNTFKDVSNKDIQKQTNEIWPQEIVNYNKQSSSSIPQKYQMNQGNQFDKKESVNIAWPAAPMQGIMNNFQTNQGVSNVPYTHQQKPDQNKKENHNSTKVHQYGIHQDVSVPPKEIQNLVNNETVKPWLASTREIQHYDKHRNEFNVQYNLHQDKSKETQSVSANTNEKQSINSWPVYPSGGLNHTVGKSCEKHRNNEYPHENINSVAPKNALFQEKRTNSSVGLNNFTNSEKTDHKSNTNINISHNQTENNNHFNLFLETPKEHIQLEKPNNTTNKTTDNYTLNYSKKTSANIEHASTTNNVNKISNQPQLKQQPNQNSTKILDHTQKEEQKSQCYFSVPYPNSSCNFNYKTDASKICPTCSYAHLNRNYPNPLYTNSNNYGYNYPDTGFNQGYYKPPMPKAETNYYPFNYDNYQDTTKCYNNTENFSKDRKNNNNNKPKSAISQNKPVNWMTTPENKQTSDCILPTFTNQSYSFSSCISNMENNDQNDHKKSLEFPVASEDKQFTWSPTKFPNFLDPAHNFVTPTLPTLVGDLALGNHLTFTDQKAEYNKYKDTKRKSNNCDNQSSNFLSVSQLVDHNKPDNLVPSRTTTRRNSGGRSKGSGTSKKSKSPKSETNGEKANLIKQVTNNSNNNFGVDGQNEIFYEQKSRNTSKQVSTNYSAEALIGNQGSEGQTKKFSAPSNKSSSFLTENIITYFPPVDENYVVPGQSFQNNTFSHNNFQNTVYSTNNFMYTASSITTTYLPSMDTNVTEFSSENVNVMPSSSKDNGKTCNNKNFRQSNNKDDKQNSCTNNSKRTNKKKQPAEATTTSSTNGTLLTNFDYPFLTVPGSTNSPILPEEFHAHNTFLPPTATPFSCKTALYQKQATDFNPNTLLPLPSLPRNSVQHPEVSPSINSAGTSFTNFNLSTIFPEINKGSTNLFQDNSVKETSNSSSVQVPFNVKRKYNFNS